ncbi:DUF4129 domain-containing protein [Natronocalculus amylovorans]|uniref:DUF4129 domain-containing protein n=1 Tax=Natronocalculus amylovorans TaxID=2917812 RepID=A0AAE3FUQ4_9EURY|nr:DUF4129 domain-containing protein [Natronocalculus amylovorans]MCL9815526.1 DUF4129 domain-containing protein [Natronocalculus amylovorans]NUE01960.1 DUF4129 domain-containing protein [Halorubraceae archaeon YAN]
MDRSALVAIAVALLAVMALAVGAATIDSAVTSDGTESGFGSGDGSFIGDSPGTDEQADAAPDRSFDIPFPCVTLLTEPTTLVVVFALWVAIGYLAYRDTGSLFAAGVLMAAVVFVFGPLYLVLAACGDPFDITLPVPDMGTGGGGDGGLFEGGGSPGEDGEQSPTVPIPTALFGLLLIIGLLGGVFLLLAGGTDRKEMPVDTGESTEKPDPSDNLQQAFGETAGNAADRLSQTETRTDQNEIYRAWISMTNALAVENPETTTPVEFCDTAVDAGIARSDAEALTRLFESVRYGKTTVTADREAEAIAILRRIEETYSTVEEDEST